MTQPFDPMDKALREALASDALPPADLTDRIMARVAETPQAQPASGLKRYRRWLVSAAACLVIAGAALPLALHGRQEVNEHAVMDQAAPPVAEYAAGTDMQDSGNAMMKSSYDDAAADAEEQQHTLLPQSGTAGALGSALDEADALLRAQGYGLDVVARTESAVQAGLLDGSGDPVDSGDILDTAMTAAGFTYADDWYILPSEDNIP